MLKNIASVVVAGLLLATPSFAKDMNCKTVDSLRPGVTVDLDRDQMIDGTVTNFEHGMVWIETADHQSIVVPKNQSIWVDKRMALDGDFTPGTAVTVCFPRDKALNVMEVNGDRVLLGSYDGVIYMPASVVSNDLHGSFYTFDPSYDVQDMDTTSK